jgi:homoserine dehydrogenase
MLIDIALVGFGNVARTFVRLVHERRADLERDHDISWRITGIATRRNGAFYDPEGLDALAAVKRVDGGSSFDRFTAPQADGSRAVIHAIGRSTAPVRILIETTTLNITDGQPAIDHVKQALESGCHVVTANKAPAAFAYRELSTLASRNQVSFLFEGAVMDGVPVFNLVRQTMPAVRIRGFRGVVNSTTNHILSALEDGQDFGPALAAMQADGIAEADPSLDLDGWDAAAKAAALANVFLDADITPHEVERSGIREATAKWARRCVADGRRLRLVASAVRGGTAVVGLTELPENDVLARLRGTANGLVLETDTLGRIAILQLDGGLTHTAYALLSDLIAVRRSAALKLDCQL